MDPPRWRQVLPLLVGVQAGLLALAVAWGWLRGIAWWDAMRLDGWVVLGVAGGVALSQSSTALFHFMKRFGWAGAEWLLDEFLGPLFRGLPLRWAVFLALLSGLCEEAFFRGVLQAEIGLLPASLLFGALHTGDRRLVVTGLWSTAVGLVLGLAYQGTGNLAVPVAMHATSNFVSFVYLSRGMR